MIGQMCEAVTRDGWLMCARPGQMCRGSCVHEHVSTRRLCERHQGRQVCGRCSSGPDAHVCRIQVEVLQS